MRRRPPAAPRGSVKVQAAAPAHVGDLADCRERTRWFPALVSNHVVDLVNKYPRDQLPDSLTGYITDRSGYDYHHHAEVGSSNAAFVGDEVTDRFCVLGLGRGAHRQAPRARRGRRRPVQHLPDERRRGGAPRDVRPRDRAGHGWRGRPRGLTAAAAERAAAERAARGSRGRGQGLMKIGKLLSGSMMSRHFVPMQFEPPEIGSKDAWPFWKKADHAPATVGFGTAFDVG